MKFLLPTLSACNLTGTTVFLRADLNVPFNDGTLEDDFRLTALQPTLDALLAQGCRIIIATHRGRPSHPEAALSTKHLIPWFTTHGYTVTYAASPDDARNLLLTTQASCILLENLRFFPGEQSHDPIFARELASLAQVYVQDAFAAVHRDDTSVTLTPALFAPEKRCIGFIVEREIAHLSTLLDAPKRPFVLILGGGKISTKLPLLHAMLDRVDSILVCPAIAFSCLAAQGVEVGKSLVDTATFPLVRDLVDVARERGVEILLPRDVQVTHEHPDGPLSIVDVDKIPKTAVGISIGPVTESLFREKILAAGTVFYNGISGYAEYYDTLHGTREILSALAATSAYTVIGGGDTVGIARTFGYAQQIDFVSTGGGATLAFLSGSPLPGLQSIMRS